MRNSEVKHLGTVISRADRDLIKTLRTHPCPDRVYAAATGQDTLERWAKAYGLRLRRGHFCIHTLTRGRKCASWCCHDLSIPGSDHTSLWVYGKTPKAIMLEPYCLSFQDMQKLVAFCVQHDVTADVDANSSYFPGRTIRILLFRRGDGLRYRP